MAKENLGQCKGRVWEGSIYRDRQCENKASVTRNGVPFCGTHDPVRVKEKTEARDKKWSQAWAERQRGWDKQKRIDEAHEPMLNALKVIAKTTAIQAWLASNDPKALTQVLEAIAKAEHG